MLWVGLTGGIATGKSTVAQRLIDLGYTVVDADQLAREVVAPHTLGYDQVIQLFGSSCLNEDGSLNRKYIGDQVFKNKERRFELEKIIHPQVRKLAEKKRKKLQAQGVEIAFYDVPLLFEKNLQSHFDYVLLVYAPPALQKERLKHRNSLGETEINQRLKAQWPVDDKVSQSDGVIYNDGDLAHLYQQVDGWLKKTHQKK